MAYDRNTDPADLACDDLVTLLTAAVSADAAITAALTALSIAAGDLSIARRTLPVSDYETIIDGWQVSLMPGESGEEQRAFRGSAGDEYHEQFAVSLILETDCKSTDEPRLKKLRTLSKTLANALRGVVLTSLPAQWTETRVVARTDRDRLYDSPGGVFLSCRHLWFELHP